MSRITNMQNEIAQLQQCLRERNATIAKQNAELSAMRAKQAEDSETITKLRKELADALKALA